MFHSRIVGSGSGSSSGAGPSSRELSLLASGPPAAAAEVVAAAVAAAVAGFSGAAGGCAFPFCAGWLATGCGFAGDDSAGLTKEAPVVTAEPPRPPAEFAPAVAGASADDKKSRCHASSARKTATAQTTVTRAPVRAITRRRSLSSVEKDRCGKQPAQRSQKLGLIVQDGKQDERRRIKEESAVCRCGWHTVAVVVGYISFARLESLAVLGSCWKHRILSSSVSRTLLAPLHWKTGRFRGHFRTRITTRAGATAPVGTEDFVFGSVFLLSIRSTAAPCLPNTPARRRRGRRGL